MCGSVTTLDSVFFKTVGSNPLMDLRISLMGCLNVLAFFKNKIDNKIMRVYHSTLCHETCFECILCTHSHVKHILYSGSQVK